MSFVVNFKQKRPNVWVTSYGYIKMNSREVAQCGFRYSKRGNVVRDRNYWALHSFLEYASQTEWMEGYTGSFGTNEEVARRAGK